MIVTLWLDPANKEGLIIKLDDKHGIPIHPYDNFERNLEIARLCERVLQAYLNDSSIYIVACTKAEAIAFWKMRGYIQKDKNGNE
jgi:hypothetical protein